MAVGCGGNPDQDGMEWMRRCMAVEVDGGGADWRWWIVEQMKNMPNSPDLSTKVNISLLSSLADDTMR